MTTEHTPLTLRLLAAADCERIAEAFARQGWTKPAAQYARYFEEQEGGRREVWVAEWAGDFAGYVTVVWESDYAPFRAAAIPEIVDLNVLKRYQQQGIGSIRQSITIHSYISKVFRIFCTCFKSFIKNSLVFVLNEC